MPATPEPGANRTDLLVPQPVRVPTGLPYGEAGQLAQAQAAVPLTDEQRTQAALAAASAAPGAGPALTRPTERPNEPITAGLPIGAGPGPEVLPSGFGGMNPVTWLEGLYLKNPEPELRDLIDEARRPIPNELRAPSPGVLPPRP